MAVERLSRVFALHKLTVAVLLSCAAVLAAPVGVHAADPDPALQCASAEKLFAEESFTEAKATYVALLGAPECPNAAAQVAAIDAEVQKKADADKASTWLKRNRATVDSWGDYLALLGSALLVIGTILLVPFILWWLVSQILKYFRAMVRVQPIVGLGADAAEGVRATFKGVLQEMSTGVTAKPTFVQLSTEPDFKLPEGVTAVEPKSALVSAFLDLLARLTPTRDVCLTATCHQIDMQKGAGVTVEVERPRGRLSKYWPEPTSVTIWESEFGLEPEDKDKSVELSSRCERLLRLGAVWFAFENGEADRRKSNRRWHRRIQRKLNINLRPDKQEFAILGTRIWRSYAFATAAELCPGKSCAALSERALDLDPGNLTARLNLAIHLVTHFEKDLPEAEYTERLNAALKHLDKVAAATNPDRREPPEVPSSLLRYRALYMRAIARLGLGDEKSIKALIVDLDRIDKATELEKAEAEQTDLGALLSRMEEPAAMVRYAAGLKLKKKDWEDPPKAHEDYWSTADGEYARACAWAALIEVDPKTARKAREANAMVHLMRAIDRRSEFKAVAETDWSLKPLRGNDEFKKLYPPAKEKKVEPQRLDVSLRIDKASRLLLGWKNASQNGKASNSKAKQPA